MSKKAELFTVALLAFSQSAYAQIQLPPSAGGQMQQIPPPPTLQKAVPQIRIEQGGTANVPAADQVKVLVNTLHVTGQVQYSEPQLIAITGFSPGSELTLAQLRAMAAKIADYYHLHGYFVAQAYLPAQDIKDGAVTIAVIEGRYGSVTLRNQSKLSDGLANGLLGGLNRGDTIAIEPLENRLLLLSDVPGVNVKSTLVPGTEVGTSDLIVDVSPGKTVNGSVEADNAGDYYTGEYRVGATVNINNLAGRGDVASLRVMTSGSGMSYGRASYQMQFGKATTGIAYSALKYRLGEEFTPLDAHGTAEIASVYGSYPLIRSRNTNLYVLGGFDAKTYQDKIDLFSSVTDKKNDVWWAGLNGNHLDGFGGGGASSYSLTQSFGDLDIETPEALAIDAATARSNGHYQKLAFNVARLQRVSEKVSLYGSVYGQFASKNLDISEKMGMGGPYAVRAYPVGEGYGDEGYVATLEARLLLPKFSASMPGNMHLVGFADTSTVTRNNNPWAPGDNSRTLSGAGVGFTWADYNNFVVNAYWAWKLGNEAATYAPDKNGRLWVQLVKYF
ncbi:MAG: ShlB/FhaC/HecB family hemolysin secretion/activation protein [Burkholderiales bacterium]|nr:ShlB/FhaC/HecB family hemolysin secretion/activation protein [Burkholderiales bacterium]